VGAYLAWLKLSVSDGLQRNAENSFVFQNPFLMNSTFSSCSCLPAGCGFSCPQYANVFPPGFPSVVAPALSPLLTFYFPAFLGVMRFPKMFKVTKEKYSLYYTSFVLETHFILLHFLC